MKREQFICALLLLAPVALANESGHEEHFPMKSLVTHGINLFVFLVVLYWALFKKMNLPNVASQKRASLIEEIESAEKALKVAKEQQEQYQQKMARLNQEILEINKNAEAQGKRMAENLRLEAKQLSQRIAEETEIVASQEMRRMKEKLTNEVVDQVIADATRTIRDQLETKTDESSIKAQLNNLGNLG